MIAGRNEIKSPCTRAARAAPLILSAKLLHMPNPLCSMFTFRSNVTCVADALSPLLATVGH